MFRLFSLYQMWKQGSTDPKGFAKGQVLDAIVGALIVPAIALILFLAFLFVLSYTHLLGGPYGIARFFFWLLIVFYAIAGVIIKTIYQTIRDAIKRSRTATSGGHTTYSTTIETGIRDAEVIDK